MSLPLIVVLFIVFASIIMPIIWHKIRQSDKKIIHIGGSCSRHVDQCSHYHGLSVRHLNKMPPFHKGCDCYIIKGK